MSTEDLIVDANSITRIVDIPAPCTRVWAALTNHLEFGAWFMVDLNEAFEPGSKSTGLTTYPGYEGLPWLATVDLMEPEHLFSMDWHHDKVFPELSYEQQPTTHVEFRLQAIPEGTRLTIIESGFMALPEAYRLKQIRLNTEGWNIQADNITRYLSCR
jgi:uncharacterized protein YndB with AHSA1/START domain